MINQQISVKQHHIVENVGDVGESLAKFDEEGAKKGKIIETSTKNNSSTDTNTNTNTNTKTSSNTDIILLSCYARNLRVLWKI